MNIIRYLEETGQTENIYRAMEKDRYKEWLAPIIHYAEENNVSAAGAIAQLLAWYGDRAEGQIRG